MCVCVCVSVCEDGRGNHIQLGTGLVGPWMLLRKGGRGGQWVRAGLSSTAPRPPSVGCDTPKDPSLGDQGAWRGTSLGRSKHILCPPPPPPRWGGLVRAAVSPPNPSLPPPPLPLRHSACEGRHYGEGWFGTEPWCGSVCSWRRPLYILALCGSELCRVVSTEPG